MAGGIEVTGMQFGYEGQSPLFTRFSLQISPGSRCLLIGANGSGKTTLLKILAGKHMVGGKDVVRVLNSSAFHDINLVCSGDLAYLGGSWSKTVGCARPMDSAQFEGNLLEIEGDNQVIATLLFIFNEGVPSLRNIRPIVDYCRGKLKQFDFWPSSISGDLGIGLLKLANQGDVPLQGDFSAEHMIFGVEGVDPLRREKLIDLLDIDLRWRMHKVSDGQRRRVQICMGLLHPYKVLLLDEVTVDLDVVTRMDLLDFFKEECDQRGATIVYATHIFDGLETWATDLAYIQEGLLRRCEKLDDVTELRSAKNLLSVVEGWLRAEVKRTKQEPVAPRPQSSKPSPFDSSPFRSSRHMAYYR